MHARHLLCNLLFVLLLLLSAIPRVTPAAEGDVGRGEAVADDSRSIPMGPESTSMEWQLRTVDDSGNVGQYTSLELDGDGVPHISYYEGVAQYNLKYAYYVGPGQGNCPVGRNDWLCQTVDSGGNVGSYTSLALDSNGDPHICYYDAGTNTNLKYAYYYGPGGNCGPSSDWRCVTVDPSSGEVGVSCSIALDGADRPHISYYAGTPYYDLRYAMYDGSTWIIETVDSTGAVGQYTSIALDTSGLAHISYYDASNGALKYASFVGFDGNCGPTNDWYCEMVDNWGATGEDTSLVLDSSDVPHISYVNSSANDLMYAYYVGPGQGNCNPNTEWHCEVVDPEIYDGGYTALALDGADEPHISYYSGDPDRFLEYADLEQGGWFTARVDFTGTVGYDSSIAVDQDLRLYISYYDHTRTNLKYAVGCKRIRDVTITGPAGRNVGQPGSYAASYTPLNATLPVSYLWSNASIEPTTIYSWTAPGVYTIFVTVTNPCSDVTETYTVTVCQAVEEVTIDGPARLPVGQTGRYTATALPVTATAPVTITWDNGTVGSVASYSWPTPGDYTIVVTGSNTCSEVTGTFAVSVCQPVTGVAIEGPSEVLLGTPTAFTATHSPANATAPVTYTWSNGSIGPVAVYTWPATGTYTIVVTATNDCGGASVTSIHVVTVTTCRRLTAVEVSGLEVIGVGEEAVYTATYFPSNATEPVTRTWDSGTIGRNAVYSWTDPGVHTIAVTATNPCPSLVTDTLRVSVTACVSLSAVTVDGPVILSLGEEGLYAAFHSPPNAAQPVTYTWDNDTVGQTAVYSWTTAGVHTITVTATNPCQVEVTALYTVEVVLCRPVLAASIDGPGVLLREEEGLYAASYSPANATQPVTITWDNGTVGPTAIYSWTAPATYVMSVTATNPCGGGGHATYPVIVCQPVEGVTIDGPPPPPVQQWETVRYTATVSPPTATAPLLTWNNGAVGSSAVYSWTIPGRHTVAVTASNVCGQMEASIGVSVFGQIYLPLIAKNRNPCYIGPGGFWEDEPNDFRDYLNPDPDLRADGPICANRLYFGYPDDPNDYFFFYCGLETVEARVDGYVPGDGGQLLLYDGDTVIGWDPGCGSDCVVSGATVDGGVCYVRIYTDPAYTTTVQPYTLQVNFQGP